METRTWKKLCRTLIAACLCFALVTDVQTAGVFAAELGPDTEEAVEPELPETAEDLEIAEVQDPAETEAEDPEEFEEIAAADDAAEIPEGDAEEALTESAKEAEEPEEMLTDHAGDEEYAKVTSVALNLNGTTLTDELGNYWECGVLGRMGGGTSPFYTLDYEYHDYVTIVPGTDCTAAIDECGILHIVHGEDAVDVFDAGPVVINEKIVSASIGQDFCAAIDASGNLWTFGKNTDGQLGDGTTTSRAEPQIIKPGTQFRQVSAGRSHCAAIDTDGKLWIWGDCSNYQIGLGGKTQTDQVAPLNLMPEKTFKTVELGVDYSAAIDSDGTLWMWGIRSDYWNASGRLEDPSAPNKVKENTRFEKLSIGFDHCAAIDADGGLWTWGNNKYGQLGDGTTTNHLTPQQILSGTTFRSVSVGGYHSAAIDAAGNLWTWGYNKYGQTGDPKNAENVPNAIKLLPSIIRIPVQIDQNAVRVTFDACGGELIQTSKSYRRGDEYGELPQPARTGYVFTGWYTAQTGGAKVIGSTQVPDKGLILYARWTPFERWGFANTADNYGAPAVGYCITNNDYQRLISNLAPELLTDMAFDANRNSYRYNVDGTGGVQHYFWEGSCYGMSASTLLINAGNDNIKDYGLENSPKMLNDVPAADPSYKNTGTDTVGTAESVINFYHFQQYLPGCQQVRATFGSYTYKKQIDEVASLAKAVQKSGKPAVVDLWWYENGNLQGHTINAIGYRELKSTDTYFNTYPHCILTFDCANPELTGDNSTANIYFNDAGAWLVPAYNIACNNAGTGNAQGINASADPAVLGPVDFKTGAYTKSASMPANVGYNKTSGAWTLKWDATSATINGAATTSDDVYILPDMTDGGYNDNYRAYVPEDKDYQIVSDDIAHTVRTDGRMVSVLAQKGGTASIGHDGDVVVETQQSGAIRNEMAMADPAEGVPSHVVLSVENATKLGMQITEQGLLISGDNLADLVIQADIEKKTVHSEEDQLLLVQKDDGTTDILEDKDDDGVFDAPAETEGGGFTHSAIPAQDYTGKAITPSVKVYHEGKLLQEKRDYTIKYTNNKNVGTATFTITGKGNYSGQETDTFTIKEKNIGDEDVVAAEIAAAIAGKSGWKYTPVPVLTYNGRKLVNNKDFTVEYHRQKDCTDDPVTPTSSRTWYAKVTGINNFNGQKILSFEVGSKYFTLVSKLTVAKIPDRPYTGDVIKPGVSVKNGGKGVDSVNYTVAYFKNAACTQSVEPVEVGTYYVKITGKRAKNYAGSRTVTFKIVGTPIAKYTVDGFTPTLIYNGEAQEQDITLLDKDKKPVDPDSYRVSYSEDRTNVGTVTMFITGTKGIMGTLKKTYKITPFDVAKNPGRIRIAGSVPAQSYKKAGAMPVPTVQFQKENGTWEDLTPNKEFTLTYSNNKAVAAATGSKAPTVKVTGKGNFKGTNDNLKAAFAIEAADMSADGAGCRVIAADVVYNEKDYGWMQKKISVVDADGKVLKAGTDYDATTIEYRFNSETGSPITDKVLAADTEVCVVVHAKPGGNYTGYATGSYRIAKQDIAKLKASLDPKTYTGHAVTIKPDEIKWKSGKDDIDVTIRIVPDSYKNNINKGKATVDVIGTGNYGGKKTLTFTIGAKGFLWWWRNLSN